jgi:ABC-type arginine transport system ATPase subunit
MSRLIPAVERIQRARDLIQQARDFPIPSEGGRYDFSYVAHAKALLQDARDLVKFIPKTPSASPEMKAQVSQIFLEADRANEEIFHLIPPGDKRIFL